MSPQCPDPELGKVWLPGVHALGEGERLVHDESAYELLHELTVEWPPLTFTPLHDQLGDLRTPPHTLYVALGTQAGNASQNKVVLLKLSGLGRQGPDEDEDDGFDPDHDAPEHYDAEPILEHRDLPLPGGALTRLRSCPQQPALLAALSEQGVAQIVDARHVLAALDVPPPRPPRVGPALAQHLHGVEAWTLAWSPKLQGRLLSGDNQGRAFVWSPLDGGRWAVNQAPHVGHVGGVLDAAWSPSEAEVFATAGQDGAVKLWDVRRGAQSVASIRAHVEANALDWNARRGFLLLSGGEEGTVKVWDLRRLGADTAPQFELAWHRAPVSSVAWSAHEEALLSVAAGDGAVSLWDLSVSSERTEVDGVPLPSQLVFLHAQPHVREVHWHPHVAGLLLSAGEETLHVWRPANI